MKLREWLYQSRLTITDFAKMLEIDRTYLQMLLSGKKMPSRKLETRIQELTEQKVSSITDIQDQRDTQDKKDNMSIKELCDKNRKEEMKAICKFIDCASLKEIATLISEIRTVHDCLFSIHPRTGEMVKIEEICLNGENIELTIKEQEDEECTY